VVNGDGPADTTPQVAPNGNQIVFNRCFPTGGCVVTTVSINGGTIHNLTDPALDSQHPNWSPDSRKIVFTIHSEDGTENIAIMNANGSNLRQLTFEKKGFDFSPAFSPNGAMILFSHFRSTAGLDLVTMSPTGGHLTQVTRTSSSEFDPEWGTRPWQQERHRPSTANQFGESAVASTTRSERRAKPAPRTIGQPVQERTGALDRGDAQNKGPRPWGLQPRTSETTTPYAATIQE
jgi:hypothetical protein